MELHEQLEYTNAFINHIRSLYSQKKVGLIERAVLDNTDRTFGNFGPIVYDVKSVSDIYADGGSLSVSIELRNKKGNNHSSEVTVSLGLGNYSHDEIKGMFQKIYGI